MRPRSWATLQRLFILFFAAAVFLAASRAWALSDDPPQKTGVLLVAFGATMPEANAAYENIEKRFRAEFPDLPMRWAYTSKKVRKILAQSGKSFDSPAEALAGMMDENFTHVAVLSLHVIPGEEYHGLVRTARAFEGLPKGVREVVVTNPLLGGPRDLEAAAAALMSMVPMDRGKDEAVVFMGHGTRHPGNVYYPAMQYYLWRHDRLAFVATVEGSPSLNDVSAELEAAGVKKAHLVPLMTVAGDHARNDMAGNEEDSLKSVLESRGIETAAVLRGAGEYDAVVDIWIGHLKSALDRLGVRR